MNSAVLAFEDGSVYRGKAFGAKTTTLGEVVFNTSMMGYEEALTEPSNYKNILVMTFVEIGCYGINEEDVESDSVKASGLVVAQECDVPSNWRCKMSLNDFLVKNNIPAIIGIDTRAITKKLRLNGAVKACISTEDISDEEAVKRAKEWNGIDGVDSVKDVTCKKSYSFENSGVDVTPFAIGGVHINNKPRTMPLKKCAVIDFGIPKSQLKSLAYSGFDVTVFPASVSAEDILNSGAECLFLSSGAGDPSALDYAHKTVATLAKKLPTFGVGLGHQVLAIALGAKTLKLKIGHHGGNYPVKNLESGKTEITAQNNLYSVDAESVEGTDVVITEVNLNDETVAGIKHKSLPVFSIQYHPEPAPGATGKEYVFDKFYNMVK
ncbi:MAG: glutamine-hydrolyzing carbamoyl-phosphate synthase small subunit [Opitutales bacterium]|nr:glutamine-hydrolyzing carbamoyl-phosphate synthase small subunit [Opitutales bacterium]